MTRKPVARSRITTPRYRLAGWRLVVLAIALVLCGGGRKADLAAQAGPLPGKSAAAFQLSVEQPPVSPASLAAANVAYAAILQSNPSAQPQNTAAAEDHDDVRDISWWLGKGRAREAIWAIVMWANLLAVLYALYYWAFRRNGGFLPPLLRGRSEQIHKDLGAADRALAEATERLRQVEARLASLQDDIASLRKQAAGEAEIEYQRILREGQAEAERMAAFARNEVEAMTRAARLELKRFAADLAVTIAEQRLRSRMTPENDRRVVQTATALIHNPGSGNGKRQT
jgi:F0F1-type ATP synthase membrane subunit b/b'